MKNDNDDRVQRIAANIAIKAKRLRRANIGDIAFFDSVFDEAVRQINRMEETEEAQDVD